MKNLNLLFNKTYYNGMSNTETFDKIVKDRNDEIFETRFNANRDYMPSAVPGCMTFELQTTYPGLLAGTGYAHGLGYSEVSKDINCGFSFDYVTGQPYIPGSSVKGILRSAFRKDELREYIADFCGIPKERMDLLGLFENQIFGTSAEDDGAGDDVFLDAVICRGDAESRIVGDDYITPHGSAVENPTPIHIIKVLPDVLFEFRFVLTTFETEDGVKISAGKKLRLFYDLAQILGVGAKTNVGYGALTPRTEIEVKNPKQDEVSEETAAPAPNPVKTVSVAYPPAEDIGKTFTAVVGKRKDPKNYYLTVNYNGSTFPGSLRMKGDAPTGEIEVIFSEISGKNYKFVLP